MDGGVVAEGRSKQQSSGGGRMQGQGFPDSHTTTVTSSTTKTTSWFVFDPSYLRTVPGILKGAQLVSAFSDFFEEVSIRKHL